MVESTIDKIKDITVERQIRKLAGIIDEQNDTISQYGDASSEIETLKTNDTKQTADIANLNNTVAPIPAQIQSLIDTDANQATQINNLKSDVAKNTTATENLNNRVTEVEQNITNTESEITTIKSAITDIQSKDVAQDGTLATHSEQIQGITESLISNVHILDGTTTGQIKVRIDRESAAAIDSNNYNLGLPVSAEIIQGTGPSMFKIQITMSTGVKVVSNDFVFTTEAIGNDVYISSFTFKAGNQDGYLSADIGLNNGVTIEANNFLVPTDPNVTSAITDLQSRLTIVENEATDINGLKTTVNEHTSEINTLNSDVANLITDKADVNNNGQTIVAGTINATNINKNGVSVATVNDIPSVPDISVKADLNNSSQTIVAGTINATNINKNGVAVATTNDIPDISGKVNIAQGTGNAGKVLGINASGNVEPVTVESGGEVWEEVDLSNFPTDWAEGERIKVQFKMQVDWSGSDVTIYTADYYASCVYEFLIGSGPQTVICYKRANARTSIIQVTKVYTHTEMNNGYIFDISYGSVQGADYKFYSTSITTAEVNKIYKMWRLKK